MLLWCLDKIKERRMSVVPDWLLWVAIDAADSTANGRKLAAKDRHDERVTASDNELLASLIRRKRSIVMINK